MEASQDLLYDTCNYTVVCIIILNSTVSITEVFDVRYIDDIRAEQRKVRKLDHRHTHIQIHTHTRTLTHLHTHTHLHLHLNTHAHKRTHVHTRTQRKHSDENNASTQLRNVTGGAYYVNSS